MFPLPCETTATYEASRYQVACVFLIFCIHFIALSASLQSLSLCIFTKISWSTIKFKIENGSWLKTEYYAITIIFMLIKLIFCVRTLGTQLIAKIGSQPNKYGISHLLSWSITVVESCHDFLMNMNFLVVKPKMLATCVTVSVAGYYFKTY